MPLPDIYKKTRPGWRSTTRISNPDVPGALITLNLEEAGADLPEGLQIIGKDPWAVLHVDGERSSPKAISRPTLKAAKDLAKQLSTGEQLRSLRRRGTGDESKSEDTDRAGARGAPPPPPRGKKKKTKKAPKEEEAQEAEIVDPATEPDQVILRQADVNEQVAQVLRRIDFGKISTVLEEGLSATTIIWVDKVLPDPDNPEKTKVIKTTEEIADHKTRLSSAKLLLEYLIGRPLERQEIIERKVVDYSEIADKIDRSPQAQRALADLLKKMKEGG